MPMREQLARAVQAAISSQVAGCLATQGYAVVDNLFPCTLADALRAEVVQLYRDGRMHKNNTHLVRESGTQLLEKAHIHEAELTLDPRVQALAPLCAQLNDDATLRTMLSLLVPSIRLDAQAIKLQYNAGQGGCFPMHLDADASLDGRVVTAIFYLNPLWMPEHGGALKLYPWPHSPREVTVEPLHNRLALFSSRTMLHRVTPFHAPTVDGLGDASARCCFTIWLHQTARPGARSAQGVHAGPLSSLEPRTSPSQDQRAALQFLTHPFVRPHVLKLVHAQEWEASLRESHPPGPALEVLLDQRRAELGIIHRALGKYKEFIADVTADPGLADRLGVRVRWL